MDGLMLHCGGEPATLEEIGEVPQPIKTDTYQPVPHALLVKSVISITTDVLPVTLDGAAFGLAKDGKQLFGHLRFRNGHAKEMGLCVGVVNSYDKSLSVKLAAGASVFVCDNLAIAGDITYMRMHTGNVLDELENAIRDRISQAEASFETIVADAARMRDQDITDQCAYQVLGQLYGERLLTNPMMTVARRSWETPEHDDFKPRTQWSLYNAITEALKLARPHNVIELHRRLHESFGGSVLNLIAVT